MAVHARRGAAALVFALLALRAFGALDLDAPLSHDASYYLYFAQAGADGAVLYRDAYETKTPLGAQLGSALVALGDRFDLEPIALLRWGWVGLSLLAWSALAARTLVRAHQPWLMCLPLGAALAWQPLWALPARGYLPKIPLFAASVAALWAAQSRAWLCCGICAALGFWDWQLGALLLPAAGAAALAAREPRALLRLGLGFALALALLVLPFALAGAAESLWAMAVARAAGDGARSLDAALPERFAQIAAVTRAAQGSAVGAALLGLAHWLCLAASGWCAHREREPGVTFAFSYAAAMTVLQLFEFDGGADLYSHVSAGLLAGFAAAAAARVEWFARRPRAAPAAALAALALGCSAGAQRQLSSAGHALALGDQRALAQQLFRLIPPAQVASVGFPELHLLARERAPGRFVYYSPNTWLAFRLPGEGWENTLLRLLEQAGARAALVGRVPNSSNAFPLQRFSAGGRYRVAHLAHGSVCYTLLLRSDAVPPGALAEGACPLR